MVGIKDDLLISKSWERMPNKFKHNKATGVDYVFFLYQSSAAFFNFIGDIVQKSPLHAIIFLRRINAGNPERACKMGPSCPLG